MWLTGLAAPRHVGSSQTRARTRVPCIGRQILNHCTTREAPVPCIFKISLDTFSLTNGLFVVHACWIINNPYVIFNFRLKLKASSESIFCLISVKFVEVYFMTHDIVPLGVFFIDTGKYVYFALVN